jgi:hypothetical protein
MLLKEEENVRIVIVLYQSCMEKKSIANLSLFINTNQDDKASAELTIPQATRASSE